ncbi:MAG: phage recombination protein Bet [Oscillospiraceae bacterium]|nr:phage recombination protein Bet [Oscillospiraceae bacterium]
MSVNNKIAPAQAAGTELKCTYKVGESEVTLTPGTVKKYLVSGRSELVSAQEIVMFINLCKYQHLNPFLREAYLIKYGENDPAQMVVGKSAFEARADRDERYQGYKAGVVVQRADKSIEYRPGTLVIPGETLVGGWCDVYVNGYKEPVHASVSLAEYNTGKSVWKSKPGTMIRKVAKAQALREAFPNAFSGMYVAEELGGSDEELPTQPVTQTDQPEVVQEEQPPQKKEETVIDVEPVEDVLDGSQFLI